MPVDLIVDGYNLMHYAGLVRKSFGPQGFERARERLLKRLQKGLIPEELSRTTVVFDGTYSTHRKRTVLYVHGIEVIYSPQGVEADDVIEELIKDHSFPKQLLIISSDIRLHRAAKKRRAGFVDSESFVEELERRAEISREEKNVVRPKGSLKKSAELSEDEIGEWLDVFDDVDPAQIAAELKEPTTPALLPPTTPTAKANFDSSKTKETLSEDLSQSEAENHTDKLLPDDPLINDVSFWQQRIDEMYREENER